MQRSDEIVFVHLLNHVGFINVIVNINLVTEEAANTTEAFAELITVGRFVRDEFNLNTKLLVVEQNPVSQTFTGNNVEFFAGFGVEEKLGVFLLFLGFSQHVNDSLVCITGVSEFVAHVGEIFPQKHLLEGTKIKGFESILNSENVESGVKRNLFEEFANNFLFLHETNTAHAFSSHSNSLIETIILTITDVKMCNHDLFETSIENVRLETICFDLGGTSHNNTFDIRFIVSNEMLGGEFTNFSNVIMTFFFSNTRET